MGTLVVPLVIIHGSDRGSTPRVDGQGNIYVTVPLRPLDRDFSEFFDVDGFGRVFYPNLFRFRVEVIDNSNSFITHFG